MDTENTPNSPQDAPPVSDPPPCPLSKPPREFPEALSGMLLKPFIIAMIAGVILSAVFMIWGYMGENDHLDERTLLYQGTVVSAKISIQSDDEETWAIAQFTYKGQVTSVPVEVTSEELVLAAQSTLPSPALAGLPGITAASSIDVVFWEEEFQANNAEFEVTSKAWLEAQTPSFAWAYFLGAGIMVIFFGIGILGAVRRKKRFEKGEGVWGKMLSSPLFNEDGNSFTVDISYVVSGEHIVSHASWKNSVDLMLDKASNSILGMVDPSTPSNFHVLSDKEIQAMST